MNVHEFLEQNSAATKTHAAKEYLDLIGLAEHGEVERRRLLVAASTLGKSASDVKTDMEAVANVNRLHRQALEIRNWEARASASRSKHSQAAQDAKASHESIDAQVAVHETAAKQAEQSAIEARNAALDLAKIRNANPSLFGPGSPYAALDGMRQVGDESNLHYG